MAGVVGIAELKNKLQSNQAKYQELLNYSSAMSRNYVGSVNIVIDLYKLIQGLVGDLSQLQLNSDKFREMQKSVLEQLQQTLTSFNQQRMQAEGSIQDPNVKNLLESTFNTITEKLKAQMDVISATAVNQAGGAKKKKTVRRIKK